MRLGYLTYGLDRDPAGIARYALELLNALAALPRGPEIVLLTTERDDLHGLWRRFERHALPGCRRLPTLMSAGGGLIGRIARRHRLDIVHDPNGIAPFIGVGGARRVVTLHDAATYTWPETHNWLDNWRYRWHLPLALRRADAVVTVSECSRRDLARYLDLPGERLHVTSEGVDPRFVPVRDGATLREALGRYGIEGPYLLYVGGINPRKNIARLLEAYGRVRERHPHARLVVAGKRQWQAEGVDAALRRLGLADAVHFTGYVADADLPAIYSGAELFVFPSLYEGFGLPPLEAMACGTPVVTSDAASLPEVVGNAALLVDPLDVGSIAAAIDRLLSHPALAADLRSRGLARARRFTWERAARETIAVYEHVLRGADRATRQRPSRSWHR